MTEDKRIIDKKHNPFYCGSWRVQNYSLTKHRMQQLEILFGKDEESIKNIDRNIGAYPAFVGIRWGFAIMSDKKLTKTDIWRKKDTYEGYGLQNIADAD